MSIRRKRGSSQTIQKDVAYKFARGEVVVKDVDDLQGIVVAMWSRFGNMDSDRDVIMPGAFTQSIAEWGPDGNQRTKVFFRHFEFIGIPLAMEETEEGLVVEQRIVREGVGREVLALYDAGAITEHSITIDMIQRDMGNDRLITSARLWEGGPVVWGANALTPTLDVKSASQIQDAITQMSAKVDQMNKLLGANVTDETGLKAEATLKAWEESIKSLEGISQALKGNYAPDEDVAVGNANNVLDELDAMARRINASF